MREIAAGRFFELRREPRSGCLCLQMKALRSRIIDTSARPAFDWALDPPL
jgi:hypothetical protein